MIMLMHLNYINKQKSKYHNFQGLYSQYVCVWLNRMTANISKFSGRFVSVYILDPIIDCNFNFYFRVKVTSENVKPFKGLTYDSS